MEFNHVPVLLDECLEGLNIRPDGITATALPEEQDIRERSLKGLTAKRAAGLWL